MVLRFLGRTFPSSLKKIHEAAGGQFRFLFSLEWGHDDSGFGVFEKKFRDGFSFGSFFIFKFGQFVVLG